VSTLAYECFNFFFDLFYVYSETEGKFVKIVPLTIVLYLDAESLAYWIMGDGYKGTNDGLIFHTEGFTFDEILF